MKKSFVSTVFAGGCIACAVVGCTSGSSQGSAPAPENNNIALVLGTSGSPFYEALSCGAEAKASELGLNLEVTAPSTFAADAQIPVVNAVTATRPAAAAVVPTDAQALIPPLQQLTQSGTKLITVDQTLADPGIAETQVVTDNVAGGRMAAEEVNRLTNGAGKVLVITQPPGSTAQDQRTEGFEAGLAEVPGLNYLGAQYQSNDPAKAAQIVTATLAAHPDLAAIFVTNDQGAIGTVTGLQQADAIGRVKVVAYDAATAEVNAFKNGSIQALIAQNPTEQGEVAVETLQAIIDGEQVEPTVTTELVTIREGENDKADQYEYKATC
ncbi:MAG: LacI family transcriptional regulator [Mycobacterium sp.]|jgi:ribose transport system substrate-binding protein|nr:LacI family transcriptional regulator [Mycobacterium sp.]